MVRDEAFEVFWIGMHVIPERERCCDPKRIRERWESRLRNTENCGEPVRIEEGDPVKGT